LANHSGDGLLNGKLKWSFELLAGENIHRFFTPTLNERDKWVEAIETWLKTRITSAKPVA
jgi:hypothetical protein